TQDTVIFTVSDVEAPQFTAIPEDFSANEGYSDLSVSWTASDLHPATYSIELDGTEVVSATTWTDGMVISYPVPDGLLEGDYNITIIAMDESSNSAQDTVIFAVNDVELLQFTAIPEDFDEDEGYSELSISWTVSDLHPATYSIELDGTEVVSATTWTDGMVISYNIPDDLSIGDHNITIIVMDESGNSAQDTVIFTVNEATDSGGFEIPGFPFASIVIFMSVSVLILKRKFKNLK
ncbi:MAG: hypothetical protein ACTSYU_00790, partial [Promethearchaeota archaeon]